MDGRARQREAEVVVHVFVRRARAVDEVVRRHLRGNGVLCRVRGAVAHPHALVVVLRRVHLRHDLVAHAVLACEIQWRCGGDVGGDWPDVTEILGRFRGDIGEIVRASDDEHVDVVLVACCDRVRVRVARLVKG